MMGMAVSLFETHGSVTWVTLNRPVATNAINLEMIFLYEEYPEFKDY